MGEGREHPSGAGPVQTAFRLSKDALDDEGTSNRTTRCFLPLDFRTLSLRVDFIPFRNSVKVADKRYPETILQVMSIKLSARRLRSASSSCRDALYVHASVNPNEQRREHSICIFSGFLPLFLMLIISWEKTP